MLGAPDEGDDDGLGRLGELDELDDELGILGMLLLDEELDDELGILGMPLDEELEELDELWHAASAMTLKPSSNRDPVTFMADSNTGLEMCLVNVLCFNNIVNYSFAFITGCMYATGLAEKHGIEGQEQNSDQLSSAFNAIRSTVFGNFPQAIQA